MIVPGQRLAIVIATQPVDFRCGHDALAAIVQTRLGLDPHSGLMVVFRSKRKDRVKILVWELLNLASDRQLGDGDLVFDRTRFLLIDLGSQQVADHLLGFVLSPDGCRHQFVVGRTHTEELEVGHRGKDLGAFHHPALRSRS